jgi:hypothetical protein
MGNGTPGDPLPGQRRGTSSKMEIALFLLPPALRPKRNPMKRRIDLKQALLKRNLGLGDLEIKARYFQIRDFYHAHGNCPLAHSDDVAEAMLAEFLNDRFIMVRKGMGQPWEKEFQDDLRRVWLEYPAKGFLSKVDSIKSPNSEINNPDGL